MAVFSSRQPDVAERDISITEFLFEGLDARPDDVAVIDGPSGAEMTAAQLKDRIQRLAGGLTEAGLAPGRVIAILAPNMPDYVTAFHGIAWAGSTVTTLNPTYTAPEIAHQLKDAGAQALITIPALADLARAGMEGTECAELILMGDPPEVVPEGARRFEDLLGAPMPAQHPVDLDLFVLVLPYSSGTTGRPKGVMLSHRNLVVNTEQLRAPNALEPGETVIAFLPFFHIYGMTVLMNFFLVERGRLVTMPRFDLEAFLGLIQTHKATRLFIVPPVALALAKHPMVAEYDLSSVKEIFSGAAPLSPEIEEAIEARMPTTRMVQGYGMTEMSPVSHSTWFDTKRRGASGTLVPGTECRIVAPETGEDCAPGVEGELWVRGPQVMLGYLGNAEATAETLLPDGWLRTGDLAEVDADGFLFLRDRLKELIKYKGFQVAPAEVEAALIAHEAVVDAAVIARPDDEAGEVPIAFVVPAPGVEVTQDMLQAHVDSCLARYKHPAEFRMVEAVPKSASGKILRRILRDQVRAEVG
ncbi:MAG: AMP-binding protein [Pseudomonadota bacterium]